MLVRKGESDISIIVFSSPLVRGKVLDACEEGGIRYFYNSIFKSACEGEKFKMLVRKGESEFYNSIFKSTCAGKSLRRLCVGI